ncbi:phospho-sugar mutase [Adhaeribacter pallidiroseus]|uniref:Phosphoglucomutase (Alpha-D-glucose-1,6-bisphosphate-dependent) n=1 Tax=Adhaeribacter pallidiroseus TaxID=2072847 RepID=A0A369QGQ4_9BACT|nr:phospho-sugar mutase [Adhaeribacter pallidiroseus]RDC62406.1 Phosphoglucomutase (alpha-D-glucose-1,6-bisphosphate-dependent) [Adhaeribacter pallidiroseus]
MIDPAIQSKIDSWLNGPYDDATKAQIRELMTGTQNESLTDAFYRDLEFGTGGLRGLMGVGSNRMNRYTLGAATQGLSNYLKKSFPGEQVKVAIAHDSRNNSPEFARIVADVFSANDIKVFFFEELRPTPELSFAIRHLGCHSGVVLTASHNPKEYNGYKAYWNDGGQVVAPHDKNIINEVNAITSIEDIRFESKPENIQLIGNEVDEAYLERVAGLSISHEAIQRQHDLKIVYTPLHGTGITLVPRILEKLGFTNVTIVEEQATPDGNFPTVIYPNPEEKEAMSLALQKAQEIDADLVLATDPDADRVGIAVKNIHGEFVLLNGNQTGSLLIYYLVKAWNDAGKLTGKEFIANTIVTTELMNRVAEKYHVKSYQTLTGFKYIAEVIRGLEGKETFIGGGEESYGYLIGDFVRDKDAIASCAMIAEMAAAAKDQGKTLYQLMISMYEEFKFFKEDLISLTKKGQRGQQEIAEMMQTLRENPPQVINGARVHEIRDYKTGVIKNLETNTEHTIDMERSNVLQFITADGSKISARPSGTEPKIKFYFSVQQKLPSEADFDRVDAQLTRRIHEIIADMQLR